MSTWKLIKLDFGRSPAHFGELGIGIEETSERVRSDTLFSGWISAYARLFYKQGVEDLLQRFINQSSPPIQMSSTFIYQENWGKTIYYLPRPLAFPINYPQGKDIEFFKTYKKLNFLPLEVWQRWYQGQGFTDEDRQELIDKTEKKEVSGKLDRAKVFDYKKTHQIGQLPKIAVDRVTRATNLYHTGFVQFEVGTNQSGLYFLLNFSQEDKQLEDNLHAALNLLGEEGIGGERSSGAGRFKVDWRELPPTWQKVVKPSIQSNRYCLISLFWDDDKSKLSKLITKESSYEIQDRGGWISSLPSGDNLRRQFLRMFVEGSVFPIIPQGKLADVTPSKFKKHRIYRSGISLSLPIKVEDE